MKPEYYIGIKMIDEQHNQLFTYADEAYSRLWRFWHTLRNG